MMKTGIGRRTLLLVSLGLAGCAPRAVPKTPLLPGHVPPAAEAAIPSDANFVLTVCEAVPDLEADTASYTAIYVDGKAAGETAVGPRSQERKWGLKLEPGNHLFRFEYWLLPAAGDWGALDAQWQPTERFIRVKPGAKAAVTLKFYEGARKYDLTIQQS